MITAKEVREKTGYDKQLDYYKNQIDEKIRRVSDAGVSYETSISFCDPEIYYYVKSLIEILTNAGYDAECSYSKQGGFAEFSIKWY